MSYLFCFKQKTAYELRISDWSSDVCSSDLFAGDAHVVADVGEQRRLDPPAFGQMRGLAAAADQTCAFALADLDVVEHTGALSRTDQRSHDLLRRMLIAELDVAEQRLQGFPPFGVTRPRNSGEASCRERMGCAV